MAQDKPEISDHGKKTVCAIATRVLETDDAFLEMGRLLRSLQATEPAAFRAARNLTGLGSRRAYYFVSISRAFDGLAVPDERLLAIGWTKLAIVAPYVGADNVFELLQLAEANTAYELEMLARDLPSVADARCVLLRIHPEDYPIFEKLMLAYGAVLQGGRLALKDQAFARLLQELSAE